MPPNGLRKNGDCPKRRPNKFQGINNRSGREVHSSEIPLRAYGGLRCKPKNPGNHCSREAATGALAKGGAEGGTLGRIPIRASPGKGGRKHPPDPSVRLDPHFHGAIMTPRIHRNRLYPIFSQP